MNIIKQKNFLLYYIGNFISGVGSVLCNFATSLFLLDLTKSATIMALYIAYTTILSIIFTPILGAFSDRISKKKVMYICDYIFGVTNILLGIYLINFGMKRVLIALFIVTTINTIITAMYQPVSQSIIPLIVKKDDLDKAYAYFSQMASLTSVFGLLFASSAYLMWGYSCVLLINGVSFIIAAILEMFINLIDTLNFDKNKNLLQDIKEGFIYLKKKDVLITLIKISSLINFFLVGIISVTMPFMIKTDLNITPNILSGSLIAMALGEVIIAMIITKSKKDIELSKLPINIGIFAIIFLMIEISYSLITNHYISQRSFSYILIIIFFVFGIFSILMQIPINSCYAQNIERKFMGRIMSLRTTLAMVITPISLVLYGRILDIFGSRVALYFSIIGMIFTYLFAKQKRRCIEIEEITTIRDGN